MNVHVVTIQASSEVLKHVYIAVATSKLLVLKSQQIQVRINNYICLIKDTLRYFELI